MKKMAIILYGHLRTYNDTHESFFKNVYEQINKHFDIDIYFHTWSKFEYFNSWHRGNLTFVNKKVDNNEVEKLKQIYKPIKFLVEEQKDGENMLSSFNRAKDLIDSPDRYDYFLITRFDIIFFTPFKLNFFVEAYNKHPLLKRFPLPKKWVMHGSNLLTWVPTADPRCLHTEAELFWISNFYPNSLYNNCIYIPIKYRLFFDYNICRSRETSNDFFIIDDSIHYRADGCLYGKKKLVEVIFDKLENSNNTFNLAIKEKDQIINSKTNQINQLQNNAQEKSTQLNQIQSKLSFQTKY
ncbi:TPA: hypothetical protein SG436_001762, partial [Campylobacter coli]|nr:hypothetical protein [Campylobacter coli]